jgi:hypothetical protein
VIGNIIISGLALKAFTSADKISSLISLPGEESQFAAKLRQMVVAPMAAIALHDVLDASTARRFEIKLEQQMRAIKSKEQQQHQ